jgi:hypothetical protein
MSDYDQNAIQYAPSGQASVEQLQRDLQTTRVVAAVGVGSALVLGVVAIMQWSTKRAAITIAQRDAYQEVVRSGGGYPYPRQGYAR